MLDNQLWRLIPAHAGKTVGLLIRQASEQAHPRSRGENQDENVINLSKQGSSPLTRGKPCLVRRRCQLRRLIPAHAGKTRYRTCRRQPSGAHPRSRGENTAARGDKIAGAGSSPLTRGKLQDAVAKAVTDRLIPAHAGKTQSPARAGTRCWAHPRSRGENAAPREERDALAGLIPAHAGKTLPVPGKRRRRRAHPRSRGENCSRANSASAFAGSSPLTRGKHSRRRGQLLDCGLIPAHAGKTSGRSTSGELIWAHTRSRGENCAAPQTRSPNSGSSPLTRGKQDGRPVCVAPHGLIPAHAGKTSRCVTSNTLAAAHPRSRGENLVHFAGDVRECGSSPLTRGKRISLSQTRCKKRLIPAHAGKTRCS